MGKRDTEVTEGGDSIVAFERFLETGDRSLLESIERYNEDDCRSTHLLREWLLARRDEAIEAFGQEIPWRPPPEPWSTGPRAPGGTRRAARRAHRRCPRRCRGRDGEQRARWLMAQLIDYHRREAKPGWWAYFERLGSRRGAADGGRQRGSRETHRLADDRADPAPRAFAFGAPHAALPRPGAQDRAWQLRRPRDREGSDGRVDRQRGGNAADQPRSHACRRAPPPRADPRRPYDTPHAPAWRSASARGRHRRRAASTLRAATTRCARSCARDAPSTSARSPGEALQVGAFDLEDAKRIAEGLDDSYLFIQGPPGSGKTYTGAHLILHLIEQGHRVGVASRQPRGDPQPARRGRGVRPAGRAVRRTEEVQRATEQPLRVQARPDRELERTSPTSPAATTTSWPGPRGCSAARSWTRRSTTS